MKIYVCFGMVLVVKSVRVIVHRFDRGDVGVLDVTVMWPVPPRHQGRRQRRSTPLDHMPLWLHRQIQQILEDLTKHPKSINMSGPLRPV